MKYLLIDYINSQGFIAYTKYLDKISYNVDQITPFKQQIGEKKKSNQQAFSIISVFGRWMVVYSANVADDKETMMYFIDFRIDINHNTINELFSTNTVNNMKKIQAEYDSVWDEKFDTVELSFAETHEKILKPNIFVCDSDSHVLAKAKVLGALSMSSPIERNTVKVSLVDEKVKEDGALLVNVYALVHFGKTASGPEGYVYVKLYDLQNNFDKASDFLGIIEGLDAAFDRAFFMERYTPEKWN